MPCTHHGASPCVCSPEVPIADGAGEAQSRQDTRLDGPDRVVLSDTAATCGYFNSNKLRVSESKNPDPQATDMFPVFGSHWG